MQGAKTTGSAHRFIHAALPQRSTCRSWLAGSFMMMAAVSAHAETLLLTGDFGYEPKVLKELPEGSIVDGRSGLFRVANSGTLVPSAETPCDRVELAVNHYPLQIRDSPAVTLLGGLFSGQVPLTSDWESTYCNSAGVLLRNSQGATVDGIRMRQVWDAVRIAESSSGFHLRGSWISEVRDDCIENDYLNGGLVEDTLLDGCFSGLSMRPPEGEERGPEGGPFVLRDVLMRMQGYPYKGEVQEGPPFKADEDLAEIEVYDSILVMGNRDTISQLRLKIGWTRIGNCSGNLLLWTAETPWPKKFARPPDCFRIVEGAEAQAILERARKNWIDCHPMIQRFEDDPVSDVLACEPDAFGGVSMRTGK
jgi:hypothetical protein